MTTKNFANIVNTDEMIDSPTQSVPFPKRQGTDRGGNMNDMSFNSPKHQLYHGENLPPPSNMINNQPSPQHHSQQYNPIQSQSHHQQYSENSNEYEHSILHQQQQLPPMQQHNILNPINAGSAANVNTSMLLQNSNVHGSEQKLSAMYNAQQHSDYIISDYMDKIATRINILETELKFAWRALDLLSGEYGKMWGRLEKLENITIEQQSVVSNLLGLYGAGGTQIEKDVGELILQQQMQFGKILQQQQAMQEMQRQLQEHRNYEMMEHDEAVTDVPKPTAVEFQHMLEDLKNDALDRNFVANFMSGNTVSRNPFQADFVEDISNRGQFTKQTEQNMNTNKQFSNGALQKEQQLFAEMQLEKLANVAASSSSTFRDFLATASIKDGLEEGIDLVEREALKKKYGSSVDNMFHNNILDAAKNNHDNVDFFRSGELNRDLYSNKLQQNNTSSTHEKVDFFRLNTDRVGVGTEAEMYEQMYRKLYGGQGLNMDVLQSGQIEDVVDHMLASRPVSSLDMIYEDNEEQESAEADEFNLLGASMHKPSDIQKKMANDEKKSYEAASTRRSKKKKQHKQHEMEALNNLKSSINKTPSNDNDNQSEDAVTTSNKKNTAPQSISVENLTRDELIALIIAEIGKIEDLTLFTTDQMNGLKQLVTKEVSFFENLKSINSNLLLLLLNPISSTDDSYETTQQKYEELKQKLHKNIEIIKKLFGNKENMPIDFITDIKPNDLDIDEILETSSKVGDDYDERTYSSSSRFASNHDINTTLDSDVYSQNLMQDNTNLNEQLKALDSREHDLIRRSMSKLNSIDNLSAEYYQQQQYMDGHGGAYQQGGQLTKSDYPQYSSNSSIYSNDEYIRSLKRSLERHNSMLFLLHLQSANSRAGDDAASTSGDMLETTRKQKDSIQMIDDDIISSCSQSPPPPAPNGEDPIETTGIQPIYAEVYNISLPTLNPFHADIQLLNAQYSQQQIDGQFGIQPLKDYGHIKQSFPSNMCTILEASPKKTKSDSGLSSMSGFSSLEKSPNSPIHKSRIAQYHAASHHNFGGSKNELHIDKGDSMFSEENLNYIRELSKNVPICSAFENKSMFAVQQVPMQGQSRSPQPQIILQSHMDVNESMLPCEHDSDSGSGQGRARNHEHMHHNQPQHRQQPQANGGSRKIDQNCQVNNYPDLVQDQKLFIPTSSQANDGIAQFASAAVAQKADESSNATGHSNHRSHVQQKHKNLTDRLVYYPSSNTITDYISSMNLDYVGENQPHQAAHQQSNVVTYQQQHPVPHAHQQQQQMSYNNHGAMYQESSGDGYEKDARTSYGRAGHSRNMYHSQDSGHEVEHHPHSQYYGRKYSEDIAGADRGASAVPSHHANSANKYLNKFSNWLPELKLKKMSKRHRSHSLPMGIENDDDLQFANDPNNVHSAQPSTSSSSWHSQSLNYNKPSSSRGNSKKKKKNIVTNTMSNIMQKAKMYRRHSFTHSSSPPIKLQQPGSNSSTVSNTPIKSSWQMRKRSELSSSASEAENDPHSGFFSDNDDTSASEAYDRSTNDEYRQPPPNMFAMVGSKGSNSGDTQAERERVNSQFQKYVAKRDNRPSTSNNDDSYAEHVAMNQMGNSSTSFQTMGDLKPPQNKDNGNQNNRASSGNESTGSDEINNSAGGNGGRITPNNVNDPTNKFIFSSTSMEFAVSRKIAKYRQKNSSDDINGQKSTETNSTSFGEEENNNTAASDHNVMENKNDLHVQQKLSGHHLQKTHSIYVEDEIFGTPEYEFRNGQEANALQQPQQQLPQHQLISQANMKQSTSTKKHAGMQMAQQHQSLDIPSRDDEDNKSQHSYRTISSSRRQSTEDSIDTDDEYFCYELRKLEELERISHMEKEASNNNDVNKRMYHEQKLLSKIDRLVNKDGDGPITKYEEEDEEDMMIMYYNSEADTYQPDDAVREKMSMVLQELKSVVQPQSISALPPVRSSLNNNNANAKRQENAYDKFAHVTDKSLGHPQPMPRKLANVVQPDFFSGIGSTDDDDGDNFMREINQFEFEIKNDRSRKSSNPFEKMDKSALSAYNHGAIETKKVTRKKRKKKCVADVNLLNENYDSEENRYSTSPYSSADEAANKSHSSGATSGPDSPCHFTDDDLEAHATTIRGITGADNYNDYGISNVEEQFNMLAVNEKQNFVKSTIITEENADNINTKPNELNIGTSGDGGFITIDDAKVHGSEVAATVSGPVTNESVDSVDTPVSATISKSKMLGKMLSHESSQDSTNGTGSSKWKLLKTLKEKKAEDKINQEKIKEEEIANKKKNAVSIQEKKYIIIYS